MLRFSEHFFLKHLDVISIKELQKQNVDSFK